MSRVVNRLPLDRLWYDDGDIDATRNRCLSKTTLRALLRNGPVEFYVADVGRPLDRIDVGNCYDFWKSEAQFHVIDDPDSGFHLEDFPGQYAYLASEWSSPMQHPIVLLEKHH